MQAPSKAKSSADTDSRKNIRPKEAKVKSSTESDGKNNIDFLLSTLMLS